MKKNLYFFLVAMFVAFTMGFSACSDDVTEIPTYPIEQGSIEIDGVTYVTNLFQCPAAGVSTSTGKALMVFDALAVTADNSVQYLKFQCNAIPVYVMEDGKRVQATYANPTDGLKISELNLQFDVTKPGPIFTERTTYVYKSGTATVQNVNAAEGTIEIRFDNLTIGNNRDDSTNATFNGTVKYQYSFLAQPENPVE